MKQSRWLALLLLLPVAMALYWFTAPFTFGSFGWMPANLNEAYGGEIDRLYYWIMVVVAVMFFLTEGLLVWYVFRYRTREGLKAHYSHGSNAAELTWTIIPGLMLVALALIQSGTWTDIKQNFPKPESPDTELIQVFAKQFNFNFRYEGKDGKFGTSDDFAFESSLTVPAKRNVLLHMASMDVIHSLFLPQMRVKQDLLPGSMTRTWFRAGYIPVWNLKKQATKDPADNIEYLTPGEFAQRKVIMTWSKNPALKVPLYKPEVIDETGQRRFGYEIDPTQKVPAWVQGEEKEIAVSEADCILHRVDLVCAELCGNLHYTMSGSLTIMPQEMYDQWYQWKCAEPAGEIVMKPWKQVWDRSFKHFN